MVLMHYSRSEQGSQKKKQLKGCVDGFHFFFYPPEWEQKKKRIQWETLLPSGLLWSLKSVICVASGSTWAYSKSTQINHSKSWQIVSKWGVLCFTFFTEFSGILIKTFRSVDKKADGQVHLMNINEVDWFVKTCTFKMTKVIKFKISLIKYIAEDAGQ